MSADISGINCVLYALFDSEGKLDPEAMSSQVRQVLSCGVNGIVVLGLATEVHKLSVAEQRDVVDWVATDIGDTVPLGVTVVGNTVARQREMVVHGLAHGAAWFILQPPQVEGFEAEDYFDFYQAVAEGFDTVFALQNAPQYLGQALGARDIMRLSEVSPAFRAIKCETPAVELAELMELMEISTGRLNVLNGRGGLEMTDCLRAGVDGFVLAPDIIDLSLNINWLWQQGQLREAEAAYERVLPAMTFMMQSIDQLICYGKRMYGLRAGVPVFDRQPALAPSKFGLECLERRAAELGSLRTVTKRKHLPEKGD